MKKYLLSSVCLLLAACGSSSDGTNSGSNSNGSTTAPLATEAYSVTGPLDTLQTGISNTLLAPISQQLPSPYNGVVNCADVAVTNNLVDIVDGLLAAGQTASTNPNQAYTQALLTTNNGLKAFIANLTQAITALNNGQGCTTGSYVPSPNLIASLPALEQLYSLLNQQGSSPNITTLTYVANQLVSTLQSGLGSSPTQAANVPVFGGILVTLQDLSQNLQTTLLSLSNYQSTTTKSNLETLVSNLLLDLSTKVVPVNSISPQSSQQIASAVTAVANQLGTIAGPLLNTVTTLANDGLSSVLAPVQQTLTGLLGKLIP